ncbi:MAG: hypothetical protein CMH60_01545 [Myxococcales bacterium]|nr:hypothetical protein [Myxococcales bacterium]|tara:strand:+ start:579 stop:773 length:195 start_codon:yes stop_codon:yes gene_type:complete
MPIPSHERRQELLQSLGDAPVEVAEIFKALEVAENLLERSLYEFGSELRTEIEQFLGEAPLLKY